MCPKYVGKAAQELSVACHVPAERAHPVLLTVLPFVVICCYFAILQQEGYELLETHDGQGALVIVDYLVKTPLGNLQVRADLSIKIMSGVAGLAVHVPVCLGCRSDRAGCLLTTGNAITPRAAVCLRHCAACAPV
jgi:hypothetical protein